MIPGPEETVLAFMKACQSTDYQRTRQAFDEYLDDACIWEQTSLPTCKGKAECLQLMDHANRAIGLAGWTMRRIASAERGDTCFLERTDDLLDKDGAVRITATVVGVFKVHDGKIVEWRDYFDPSVMAETR